MSAPKDAPDFRYARFAGRIMAAAWCDKHDPKSSRTPKLTADYAISIAKEYGIRTTPTKEWLRFHKTVLAFEKGFAARLTAASRGPSTRGRTHS